MVGRQRSPVATDVAQRDMKIYVNNLLVQIDTSATS
jgi:hypothetical protein